MTLLFRPIDQWPDGWQDPHRERPYSPFDSSYSSTLTKLDSELWHLGTPNATLQVDAAPGQIRQDGQLRADAKVTHPGVILTIDSPNLGVLVYSCDRYVARGYRGGQSWHQNLRAIALGLEALRKVERYGIADRGQQYAGFGALGSGTPMGQSHGMDPDRAARVLLEAAGWDEILGHERAVDVARKNVDDLYKTAAKRYHPDSGHKLADGEVFARITLARDVLKGDA